MNQSRCLLNLKGTHDRKPSRMPAGAHAGQLIRGTCPGGNVSRTISRLERLTTAIAANLDPTASPNGQAEGIAQPSPHPTTLYQHRRSIANALLESSGCRWVGAIAPGIWRQKIGQPFTTQITVETHKLTNEGCPIFRALPPAPKMHSATPIHDMMLFECYGRVPAPRCVDLSNPNTRGHIDNDISVGGFSEPPSRCIEFPPWESGSGDGVAHPSAYGKGVAMSWRETSLEIINRKIAELAQQPGWHELPLSDKQQQIQKAIKNSYPYSYRGGWAYQAWLNARADIFAEWGIPTNRKKPRPPANRKGWRKSVEVAPGQLNLFEELQP